MVLLLVLVVITMLALGVVSFAELMVNEHRAALASSRQSQARAFAYAGAELARQFLDRTGAGQNQAGGLYDNESRFSSQIVAEDKSPRDKGRFTIVAPRQEDTAFTGVRYGLIDESSKINLATILNYDKSAGSEAAANDPGASAADATNSHLMLMGLPGMTDAAADAILDWIDSDDTARDQGMESEYYTGLSPAYVPRNAPPTTIDELLLIPGVTPELLFGYDAVKLGYSTSDSVSGVISGIGTDGSMDHGWAAYLTLWSSESNLKSDGTPKINLNQPDLGNLYTQLSSVVDQSSAQFIYAYRQGGGTADSAGNLITTGSAKAVNTLSSPLDLVGAADISLVTQSSGGSGGGGGRVTLKNPFTADSSAMNTYLPTLFENCTTTAGTGIPGRININQASRTVLMCIPGMTSDLADQIISSRIVDPTVASSKPDQSCPAWPLIEGIVPLATMKQMLPYVTAGGGVFRAQIVGKFDKGTPTARLEVILDSTQHPTRIVFWKDIPTTQTFPGETSGGTTQQ
jgi:DNA uptake protein ComE-like DNA-binding protein